MLTDKQKKTVQRIKAKIAKHIEKRNWHEAQAMAVRSSLRPYQELCGHPNGYQTFSMGEPTFRCDDCGMVRG